MVVSRVSGEGDNEELLFNGYRLQFYKAKKSYGEVWCDGCTTLWIYSVPLNGILKNG